jgi:hypothetical protein
LPKRPFPRQRDPVARKNTPKTARTHITRKSATTAPMRSRKTMRSVTLRFGSAEMPRYNVVDELCLAGAQGTPTWAGDDERGKRTGRELLFELR